MNIMRHLCVVIMVLALSGCGAWSKLTGGGNNKGPQPAELVKFDAEIKLRTEWSKNVGDGPGKKFNKLVPAIEGDTIYAVDNNGRLIALNRQTGKQLWRAKLKLSVSGGVGAGFDRVLLGTTKGEIVVLDAADGGELWRRSLSSEILSPPQTNGDIVLVQTLDEKVYGLNFSTGEQRWLYESIVPPLTLRGTSTPILTTSLAMVGLANGKVVGLNADNGQLVWEKRIATPQGSSELQRMIDIDGDMLLQNQTLYVAGFQGNISAIDVTTSRIRWQKRLSSYGSLDEGFGNVYVSDELDHVHAFDGVSSQSSWKQAGLDRRQITGPVTFGNYVAVGDADGYVHFMAQSDGRFVARRKVDSKGIRSKMLARGDKLYVYGNSGKLVALSVR